MAVFKKSTIDEAQVDDLFVNGSFGVGQMLRWAYRFYGDPSFLYLARKYELTLGGGTAPVTLMPKANDLNFFREQGRCVKPRLGTQRHPLRLKGPGYALDRGVRRAQIQPVQDKLILATGSHARSPSLLMDLSFTQSKAMVNRRMGIDNHLFNGIHTVTIVGRPAEAERTNRILIAPDDRPFPGTGNVKASEPALDKLVKESSLDETGYELHDYFATCVNKNLAYGEVEYAKLQVAGVHAKRRLALLNNGVLVVEDNVWSDEKYAGGKLAGAIYNVWSDTSARGQNWVVSTAHRSHLPDSAAPNQGRCLVYFAPTSGQKIEVTDNRAHDTFCCSAPLAKEGRLRILSVVIPLPNKSDAASIGNGIETKMDANGTTVRIPYAQSQILVVQFPHASGLLQTTEFRAPAHRRRRNRCPKEFAG